MKVSLNSIMYFDPIHPPTPYPIVASSRKSSFFSQNIPFIFILETGAEIQTWIL